MASIPISASSLRGGPDFQPSVLQGVLLVMGAWCTVLAAGVLGPVLPRIEQHFAGAAHLDLMIGFVATMPSLAVAVLAFPLGRLADRVGQRPVLLVGLAGYGLAGVLPFWMESLQTIILARLAVGVGEAAVMTASTAMIGLYFNGPSRTRWLGAQVASANILGVLTLLCGGLIGSVSWRAPFLVYAFALVLLAFALPLLREPPSAREVSAAVGERLSKAMLGSIAAKCALIFFTTIALFVIIIQMSFLLHERGVADSARIGSGMSLSAVGVAVGATVAGSLARWAPRTRLTVAFGLLAVGFAIVAQVSGFAPTVLGGMVAGLGAGLIIPTLLSVLVAETPPACLGSVIGAWVAATFIGQFANPPLFLALRAAAGSLSGAILWFALACVAVAALVFVTNTGASARTAADPTDT